MDRRILPTDHDFGAGEVHRIASATADLRCVPDQIGLDRQLVFGDQFRVFRRENGLAFGVADRGDYLGYIPETSLGDWQEPTHQIAVRGSLGFMEPNFKHPDPIHLTLGARLAVQSFEGKFARTLDGLYVPASLLPALNHPSDPAHEAEKLMNTPYLWGGNSSHGIDCSGLVQAAFIACGFDCPGDSDLQQDRFGDTLPAGTPYLRNDLLFWRGHVALVVDEATLIHANAHHMAVVFEPITDAISRIAHQGDGPVTAHKRIV
jgi:cell wall-associated NlpC family hydrolase